MAVLSFDWGAALRDAAPAHTPGHPLLKLRFNSPCPCARGIHEVAAIAQNLSIRCALRDAAHGIHTFRGIQAIHGHKKPALLPGRVF